GCLLGCGRGRGRQGTLIVPLCASPPRRPHREEDGSCMQAPLLVTPSREMPAYRAPLALGDAFDNRLWESTHERDWLFFSYLLFNFSKGLIRSPVTPRTLPIETSHIPTL